MSHVAHTPAGNAKTAPKSRKRLRKDNAKLILFWCVCASTHVRERQSVGACGMPHARARESVNSVRVRESANSIQAR